MRKSIDEHVRKFEQFLEIVNLVNQKTIKIEDGNGDVVSNSPVRLLDISEDVMKKLNNGLSDLSIEDEIQLIKKSLWLVANRHFENPEFFFQFLFQKNSPEEIGTDSFYFKPYDHGDSLWEAVHSYQFFRANYNALENVMKRIGHLRQNDTLPKAGKSRMVGREQGYIDYYIDSRGQLDIRAIEQNHFYGFRDFARIKLCENCGKYFLAKRTDAKYCSVKCGDAKRQDKWLENEENHQKYLKAKRDKYRENALKINENRKFHYSRKKKENK